MNSIAIYFHIGQNMERKTLSFQTSKNHSIKHLKTVVHINGISHKILLNQLLCYYFSGPYVYADVMDIQHLSSLVVDCNVDWLVHFSALLSAIGEQNFEKAMEVLNFSKSPITIVIIIMTYTIIFLDKHTGIS